MGHIFERVGIFTYDLDSPRRGARMILILINHVFSSKQPLNNCKLLPKSRLGAILICFIAIVVIFI